MVEERLSTERGLLAAKGVVAKEVDDMQGPFEVDFNARPVLE